MRQVQLDSVNVLVQAHYVPFFSRVGPYDLDRLDRWLWRSGELFEYWGHAATLMHYPLRPLMTHRMEAFPPWRAVRRLQEDRPGFIDTVFAEVRERGPLPLAGFDAGHARSDPWWGWRDEKHALEWLFVKGRVTVAERRNFAKVYELPHRIWNDWGSDPVDATDAAEVLLAEAAAALGVGTAADLADYFRLNVPASRPILENLVRDGRLIPAEVDGWRQPGYLHPDAVLPRSVEGAAILSPFDPLIWFRPRVERLFGFRYRIEIYVPAAQRQFGYYVLPFLLDGHLVARVDLKSDRKGRRLLVRGSYIENGQNEARVAEALATELRNLAGWLDLDDLVVEPRGSLAPSLSGLLS